MPADLPKPLLRQFLLPAIALFAPGCDPAGNELGGGRAALRAGELVLERAAEPVERTVVRRRRDFDVVFPLDPVLDPGFDDPPPPADEPPAWTDPTGSANSAETVQGERWVEETVIGVAPPGYTCPAPPADSGWTGGLMFGERAITDQPLEQNGGLFCRYHYSGPDASLAWSDLPDQLVPCGEPGIICQSRVHGARWLHPDARVATAQAPGLLGVLQARLQAEYLQQMDVPLLPLPAAPGKVDLAVLDSLRDSAPGEYYPLAGDGHGRAIGMAAFRTACPGGLGTSCPINLRFYRAFEPGTVASLSDLAQQIVRATDDSVARGAHLVQNVSLGLHPRFAWWEQPGQNPDFPAGVLLPAFRAVKAALNYASARGVIVVAAAGNSDGSSHNPEDRSDELLYPAAFDGETGWSCDASRSCTTEARPLVYAAGGITAEGEPLPNARFSGHSVPFVAPACNVALDNQLPWESAQADLPTYCGTSFGAIGVSSVLAATWSQLPNASPQEVIDVVRAAGVDLHTGQPGCAGTDCRVRMCHSLAAAGAAVSCGALPLPPSTSDLLGEFVSAHGLEVAWTGADASDATDVECGSDVVYAAGAPRNADACPAVEHQTSLPDSEILCDQPGDPQCPQCSVAFLRFGTVSLPYFIGAMAPTTSTITSPSLAHASRTYELGASLGPLFSGGGSFAIPLLQTPSTSTPGAPSGVATFSYLKRTGSAAAVAHIDPIPVVR
jgi:hypothetical protein